MLHDTCLNVTGVARAAILPIALAASLCACAGPSGRIAAEMNAQGFDPGFSACVGERLPQRLSTRGLLRVRRALRDYQARGGDRLARDPLGLLQVTASLGDPRLSSALVATGVECGAGVPAVSYSTPPA